MIWFDQWHPIGLIRVSIDTTAFSQSSVNLLYVTSCKFSQIGSSESAVLFHSLGEKMTVVCRLFCSPIYFYCLITILMSSNLYFCCSSIFYTIISAGRWFEYAVWERLRASGGYLTKGVVYGVNTHDICVRCKQAIRYWFCVVQICLFTSMFVPVYVITTHETGFAYLDRHPS